MTKRLYRSDTHRVLAGVCGGIGDYLNIDPTIVRIVVVALALVTNVVPLILAYIVAIILIPVHPVRSGRSAHATESDGAPVRDAEVEEKK